MSMHVLVDVVEREITIDFFSDVESAKAELSRRFDDAWGVSECDFGADGMSAWASGKADSDWCIEEVPVDEYLGKIFEEYKGKSGWKGLSAEDAVESFIRFVEKGA